MSKKIFFLTTEIVPFANTSLLGTFSAKVPLFLQEKEHDIRTMLPKYGFVSERKYILREVIRLREIPFEYEGITQTTSAKSAFIPKTRVQVYFMEHLEWFKPLSNLLYKSKNGRYLSDNDIRFSFYGKAALATLPHLFWSPDIVMCNGWQSAFVPMIYDQCYRQDDFYKDIKTVQIVHSVDDQSNFSLDAYHKAGLKLPNNIKGDTVNGFSISAQFADLVIVIDTPNNEVSEAYFKLDGTKDHEDKTVIIEYSDIESPNMNLIADSIDDALTKLS